MKCPSKNKLENTGRLLKIEIISWIKTELVDKHTIYIGEKFILIMLEKNDSNDYTTITRRYNSYKLDKPQIEGLIDWHTTYDKERDVKTAYLRSFRII